jgi:hypothetical protein
LKMPYGTCFGAGTAEMVHLGTGTGAWAHGRVCGGGFCSIKTAALKRLSKAEIII